jgi:iron complex transport system ATP-binding protein
MHTASALDPSASALALAVVEDAGVIVDGKQLLGPVSLEIGAGEHWALLGPNGAGKTTLLSLLGAQRHPSFGVVTVLGRRLGRTDMRALRAEIGVVGHSVADRLPPEATALEIVLTGRDGILAPWWASFDESERGAARALLERLHCGHLAAQRLVQCSQGERQRILLARSLFGRHALLLLDEPAVGVDLPGREALVAALDALARSSDGPATVQVAHTLEELPSSTSHAMLLRAGGVVAAGPAEEVLADAPLSACFGLRVEVHRAGGRYSARAASSW